MTGRELWASLLQEAISGRLVEQRDDEPEVRQIGVPPEEVPFEIPEKWKWVKLKEVTKYLQRGKSPIYSDVEKYPVISQKCNQWDGFHIEKVKFISPETITSYSKERILQNGDILINSTGLGTLGRASIYEERLNPYEFAVTDSHVTVVRLNNHLTIEKYLYFFWSSPSVQNIIEEQSSGSTKQKELSLKTIQAYPLPLPPLTEQRRIVAKLEALRPLVDEYTQAEERLSALTTALPDRLRASILQEAIQGRLVPQRDDEPAVPIISVPPKDVPFEIPEKWRWVRLGTLGKTQTGMTPSKQNPEFYGGRMPFIKPANIDNGNIIQTKNDEFLTDKGKLSSRIAKKNSILMVCIGTIGKCAITHQDVSFNQQINCIYIDNISIYNKFIFYVFNSLYFTNELFMQTSKTTISIVNKKKWEGIFVPLPPIEEQHRIVAKIEELLPEIDKLAA